jgi:hypothetical protein
MKKTEVENLVSDSLYTKFELLLTLNFVSK